MAQTGDGRSDRSQRGPERRLEWDFAGTVNPIGSDGIGKRAISETVRNSHALRFLTTAISHDAHFKRFPAFHIHAPRGIKIRHLTY